MKKFLVIILAAMMALAMCACGNDVDEEETTEVANPVHECTKEELLEATGIDIDAPEGASDVEYAYIDSGDTPIAQVEFELNDQDYCYRAQSTAITALGSEATEENLNEVIKKAVDTGSGLAGLHYEWKASALVDSPDGKDSICALNEGDEGFIAWLDVVPGFLYSLSVDDDSSMDSLMEMAELVFVPMQGEVG